MTDALNATRAAVEEGIVPGGGVALLRYILKNAYLFLCPLSNTRVSVSLYLCIGAKSKNLISIVDRGL